MSIPSRNAVVTRIDALQRFSHIRVSKLVAEERDGVIATLDESDTVECMVTSVGSRKVPNEEKAFNITAQTWMRIG